MLDHNLRLDHNLKHCYGLFMLKPRSTKRQSDKRQSDVGPRSKSDVGPRSIVGLLVECRGCGRMLPKGWFRTRKGKQRVDGTRGVILRSQCRPCEKPARAAAAANRRKKVRGSYTAKDVEALALRQGKRCRGCGRHLSVTGYHVDHIRPIAKGGLNVAGNLQLLCPRCNLRKGSK